MTTIRSISRVEFVLPDEFAWKTLLSSNSGDLLITSLFVAGKSILHSHGIVRLFVDTFHTHTLQGVNWWQHYFIYCSDAGFFQVQLFSLRLLDWFNGDGIYIRIKHLYAWMLDVWDLTPLTLSMKSVFVSILMYHHMIMWLQIYSTRSDGRNESIEVKWCQNGEIFSRRHSDYNQHIKVELHGRWDMTRIRTWRFNSGFGKLSGGI